MNDPRPYRAALLSLVLGVLCLGSSLLPGRTLLPMDARGLSPFVEDLGPIERAEVERANTAAVPHRMDRLMQFLPYDAAVGAAWRRGEVPVWDPHMLCGVPLLGQATSRPFYPTALLFALFSPEAVYAWSYLLHLVLGGTFLYRLARRLGAEEAGALLGTTAFVLSGYAVGHLHHPMIFFAAVWTLPALEATHALMRPRAGSPRGAFVGLALSTALSWTAGFPQASVLLVYLVVALAAALALERRERLALRPLAHVGLALALGLGLAAVQILPALEASAESSRAPARTEVLRERALTAAHLTDLVLPGQVAPAGDIVPERDASGLTRTRPSFLALATVDVDRSESLSSGVYNHTEVAFGLGIWPLLFALLTLGDLVRGPARGPGRAVLAVLWGATLLGVLAALAVPGVVQAVLLLPGFAVGDFKRLLMLPAFALPVLAALGWRSDLPRIFLARFPAGLAALLAGLWVLSRDTAAFVAWAGDWIMPRIGADPALFGTALLAGEAELNRELLGGGLVALGAALLLPDLLRALLRTPDRLAWAFVLPTAIELLPVAWDASPAPRAGAFAEPPTLVTEGLADATPPTGLRPRVLRLEPSDTPLSVSDVRLLPPNMPWLIGLADAAGYAPLPPARVQEVFEHIEPGAVAVGTGFGALRELASTSAPLFPLFALDGLLTTSALPADGWERVASRGDVHLDRPRVAPRRARLFFETREVASLPELPGTIDPLVVAPLEPESGVALAGAGGSGSAEIVSATAATVEVEVECSDAALLVLSEAWAEGWSYRVDGGAWQPALVSHHFLRAAPVPAGEHRVEFRYTVASLRPALGIALAALVGLVAAAVALRPERAAAGRS